MRILQITDAMGWSGGTQQVLFLCKGLKDKGHDVLLACCRDSEIEKIAIEKGISLVNCPMRQDYDIFTILSLKNIIKKYKIEIVHSQHPKAHALGLSASFIAKVPVFIFTRRVIFNLRKNIFSQIKYNSKRINKIIAVSEGVKKVLVEYGILSSRIEVIHSGTDLQKFNSKINSQKIRDEFNILNDAPLVGLIGNFSYYKGHTFFLEAIPLVLKKIPQAKFILAGRDTDGRELSNLVDKLGIGHNTILAGFRRDIPQVLAATDLTVNASLQEGFAGTIRESLAMEKPVVVTNVGGNSEMVIDKENGLLVPPADSQSLAEGIINLLADRQKAIEMGKKGRRLVEEKFSVENMVDKTEKLYESLLKEKMKTYTTEPQRKIQISKISCQRHISRYLKISK